MIRGFSIEGLRISRPMQRRLMYLFMLIVFLSVAHELGHVFFYNLLHPELVAAGFPARIELSIYGLQTKYLVLNQGAKFWVFAGGLIFTLPFLLLLPKLDWLSNSIIVGFILYGALEVMLL